MLAKFCRLMWDTLSKVILVRNKKDSYIINVNFIMYGSLQTNCYLNLNMGILKLFLRLTESELMIKGPKFSCRHVKDKGDHTQPRRIIGTKQD